MQGHNYIGHDYTGHNFSTLRSTMGTSRDDTCAAMCREMRARAHEMAMSIDSCTGGSAAATEQPVRAKHLNESLGITVRVHVHACVRACVRPCVRACVRAADLYTALRVYKRVMSSTGM